VAVTCTTYFKNQKLCILPTEFIYGFRMILSVKKILISQTILNELSFVIELIFLTFPSFHILVSFPLYINLVVQLWTTLN
jgi:hypothetical protein